MIVVTDVDGVISTAAQMLQPPERDPISEKHGVKAESRTQLRGPREKTTHAHTLPTAHSGTADHSLGSPRVSEPRASPSDFRHVSPRA